MQRKPEGTASILMLVVLLHRKNQPWPTRAQIAEHLQVSRPLVDMVISQRQATGHITIEDRIMPGNVARRPSVRRERFIIPSGELIQAVAAAEREEQLAKRRDRRRETKRGVETLTIVLALLSFAICQLCVCLPYEDADLLTAPAPIQTSARMVS